MPLDFQLLQAPLRYGLAEGVDPHQVPWGTLVTAENCVWRKTGRLEKRYGTSILTRSILGGGTLSAGARLFTRGAELVAVDGTNVYSYSPNLGVWTQMDAALNVGLTWTTALDTTTGASAFDMAVGSNGVACQAWVTGDPTTVGATGTLIFRVVDITTGVQVQAPLSTGVTAFGVRVVASGTTAFVVYRTGANIGVFSVDLTTGSNGSLTNLRTDAATTAWDAMVIGTSLVIAYENNVNALKLYRYTYSAPATYTQAATGGVTGEAGNTFRAIAIDGVSSERIWVAYYVNSATKVRCAAVNDSTLAQTIAPFDVEAVVAGNVTVSRDSATTCVVGYSEADASGGRATTVQCDTSPAANSNTRRGTWGTRLVSRIFAIGTRRFAFVADVPISAAGAYVGSDTALVEIDTSSKGLATDWFPHRYVGRVDPLIGGISVNGMLPSAYAKSSTEALVPVPFLSSAVQKAVNWRVGYRLADVTIGASLPADMWRAVTYGQESYLAAGLIAAYDGQLLFDYGFPHPPVYASSSTTTPGGNMAAGTYLYAQTLEYRSRAGVLHRSGAQSKGSVSPGAGSSFATVNLLASSLTAKQKFASILLGSASAFAPMQVVMHRSVSSGTTYYREAFEPTYNVLIQDVKSELQVFTDTNADSDIGGSTALSTRPTLYTTGGILDDFQPPSATTLALYRSRLWAVDGSQRQVWYSKSFLDDYGTAPGFSTSFRVQFDQNITGMLGMDEKLVIFWSGGLWVMAGDGPAPDGSGSDLGLPNAVQSDVGCTNPRSLVAFPDGVMFQAASTKLYLLTRGLEMVWLGRAVQDELAAYPNITSAVLVPSSNEVRFTANNAGATAGIVLIYNYVEKQWSTAKYTVNGVYGAPIADACLWNGVWTFITPSGFVVKEDTTTYLDGGATWVPLTIETAWASASGPLTFQSVRSFQAEGISNTNHDLTIACTFDGDTSYPQSKTFTAQGAVTTIGPLESFEIAIGTRRKCQHIRFKVTDATPTTGSVGTGQGPSFDTFGIEVGVKKGYAPNPATKKG